MCGGRKGEEEDLTSMDGEEEKPCSRPVRVTLFILNFIIWLGSCALLALGIYGLFDTPFAMDVLDGNSVMLIAVVFIVVGGIGFVISFIGCCGAFLRNKCLILTYVIVLILILAIMLIGGILGFMFTSRLQTAAVEAMRKSMVNYDKDRPEKKINKAWDTMQRSIKCCGIMNSQDWEVNNKGYSSSNRFPESCCVIDPNTQAIRSGCTSGTNSNNFHSNAGCHKKLMKILDEKSPIVGIVGAVVALCMILGSILGIVAYNKL